MRFTPDSRAERGLSLVEVLVATTVVAIAGTVALFLYDDARKSFRQGENAAEQQQAVRAAFDEMSTHLRLAGFNHNPDGSPNDPDEPFEAAFDTAIALRADFDAEDPTESAVPEDALSGGPPGAISIGNDEIVAYVLARPDGSSADTLTFEADVKDVPRDGVTETVRIPNVSLVQDRPPYTLYRITLNSDPSTWGGGNFVVRTPLLENVRSLTFRYSGLAGPLNGAFDLTTVAEDIGGADALTPRRLRSQIRRIQVDVEGLTRDPDLGWEDPSDTNPATRPYRKFHLRGTFTPRNQGRRGLPDVEWGNP